MGPKFRMSHMICIVSLLPTIGSAFSVAMFKFWDSSTKAPTDPCASAAEPEKCHYNQAVNMLAHMTAVPSASKVPLTASIPENVEMDVIGRVTPEAISTVAPLIQRKVGSIAFLETTPAPRTKDTSASAKEEQSVALLLALGALEGEELPAPSLEKATIQLEEELNKLQPGALTAFRARRLAEAMNHHGPPKPAEKRASEALEALQQIKWSPNSAVTHVIRDLQPTENLEEKSKTFSLFQWVVEANAQSSGQLWVLFIFVLSLLMLDRMANEVAMLPNPQPAEHHGYGAMGNAAVRH